MSKTQKKKTKNKQRKLKLEIGLEKKKIERKMQNAKQHKARLDWTGPDWKQNQSKIFNSNHFLYTLLFVNIYICVNL